MIKTINSFILFYNPLWDQSCLLRFAAFFPANWQIPGMLSEPAQPTAIPACKKDHFLSTMIDFKPIFPSPCMGGRHPETGWSSGCSTPPTRDPPGATARGQLRYTDAF